MLFHISAELAKASRATLMLLAIAGSSVAAASRKSR